MAEKGVKSETNVPKFAKDKIIASEKYKHHKDVLHVILKDDEFYSLDDVDKAIQKFMKGKVK